MLILMAIFVFRTPTIFTSVKDEGVRSDTKRRLLTFRQILRSAVREKDYEKERQTRCSTKTYQIPEITVGEVAKQMQLMKNGMSVDAVGNVIEMIKAYSQDYSTMSYCDWKHTRINGLLKNGDPHLPNN